MQNASNVKQRQLKRFAKTIHLLGVFVAVRGGTALMNSGSWFGAFTRGFVEKVKLGELFV